MNVLKEEALKNLRDAREEILSTPKSVLSFIYIESWFIKWSLIFLRVQSLGVPTITFNINKYLSGYQTETNKEILDEIRLRIVELIDSSIKGIDQSQKVRPILEERIGRIKDTKLSELSKEFNAIKDSQPNLAGLGFRTILTLIIRERAKVKEPNSLLALKDDMVLEPDIKEAINLHIFDKSEEKLLARYLSSGNKDILDNIAHKASRTSLINKDDLSDAVTLLNKLLASII